MKSSMHRNKTTSAEAGWWSDQSQEPKVETNV